MTEEITSIGVGQIRETNQYGPIELLEKRPNRRYLVRFLNTGYEREAIDSSIRKGCVKDLSLDTAIKEGSIYPTKFYGNLEVIERINKDEFMIKFVDSGEIRKVFGVAIRDGSVRDTSKPKALYGAIRIGNTYQSNKHGFFKVLSYHKKKFTIEFLDTGTIRTTDRTAIVNGSIRDNGDNPTPRNPMSGALSLHVGDSLVNRTGQRYTIIHIFNSNNITVRFVETGTERKTYAQSIRTGQVWDCMVPKYQGVGYAGSYDKADKILQRVWHGMLTRHVSDKFPSTVVPEWLNFSTFCKDVKTLVNFDKWYAHQRDYPDQRSLYHFDKDLKVLGNTVYGPETCMFIEEADNLNEKDLRKCMSRCIPGSKSWKDIQMIRDNIRSKYVQG